MPGHRARRRPDRRDDRQRDRRGRPGAAHAGRGQDDPKAIAGLPPVPVFVDEGFFFTIDPTGTAAGLIALAGGANVAAAVHRRQAVPAQPAARGGAAGLPRLRRPRRDAGGAAHEQGHPRPAGGARAPLRPVDGAALSDTGPRVVAEVRDLAHLLHPSLRHPVSRYDAVLLDAFGTLIDIDEPYVRLRRSLRRHLGVEVSAAAAERAFLAEMAYYADHCHEGADAGRARRRCGRAVPRSSSPSSASTPIPPQAAVLLGDSIAFRAFADVAPLLAGLRAAQGWRSPWSRTGTARCPRRSRAPASRSASCSTRPRPARRSPTRASSGARSRRSASSPARALHVGDTEETDGVGARAAGVDVRILDRGAGAGGPGYDHRPDRRARPAVTDPPRRTAATTAIHAGRLPALPGVPVIAPVHRSVIHEFVDADEFAEVMGDSEPRLSVHPHPQPLDRRAGRGRGRARGRRRPDCASPPAWPRSSAAVAELAPPGAGLVAATQIYGQTHHMASARPDGRLVDMSDMDALREAVAGAALVVCETVSNPQPGGRRHPRGGRDRPRRRARGWWSTTRSRRRSTAARSSTAPTSSSTPPPST